MKQIALLLTAVLLSMCGGKVGNTALQAPEDDIAASVPRIDYEPLDALVEAAPASLLEDILRQLPKNLLPDVGAGKDPVQALLTREDEPDYPFTISWFQFEGECDVVGIEIQVLPCLDGSWLVTYFAGSGCDCYVQDDPVAFVYRDGRLSECEWPLPELTYEDFATPLVERLESPEALGWVREYWSPSYNFDYANPYLLTAVFNDIDHWMFSAGCRPIEFYWNGKEFLRHDGRYSLVEGDCFAGYRLGEPIDEEVPEGYAFVEDGGFTFLQEQASGRRLARFALQEDGTVREITALQPDMSIYNMLWPGQPLADALEAFNTTPPEIRAYTHGKDEVLLCLTEYYHILLSAADIEGEPNSDCVYPVWSPKPGTRVLGILADTLPE